ncbi:MAG: UvrB/UvrC motif-containing protein [Oscillospiraceae bacterium]|nr:UvrB/UvrC motif-containing protein [Oscillospiraceae bacterium]
MKCQSCGKNEALFHYSGTVNGQRIERHLCAGCAAKLGYEGIFFGGNGNHSFDALYSGLMSGLPDQGIMETTCPQCKTTWREILQNGKVGCANCYSVFEELLGPYIHKIHGDATHKGHAPQNIDQHLQMEEKLLHLRAGLEVAVKEQNYEQAAVLRDEIRALEGEKKQ